MKSIASILIFGIIVQAKSLLMPTDYTELDTSQTLFMLILALLIYGGCRAVVFGACDVFKWEKKSYAKTNRPKPS